MTCNVSFVQGQTQNDYPVSLTFSRNLVTYESCSRSHKMIFNDALSIWDDVFGIWEDVLGIWKTFSCRRLPIIVKIFYMHAVIDLSLLYTWAEEDARSNATCDVSLMIDPM